MCKPTKDEVQERQRLHELWLKDPSQGRQADFSGFDLRGMDLQGYNFCCANFMRTNLRGANLQYTNFQYTNFQDADIQHANLQGAILQHADLQGANLRGTILRGTNLKGADLKGTNLQCAYLQGTDLQEADLQEADLRGAYLKGVSLRDATKNHSTIGIHPAPEGDLIGWGQKSGHIVKLLIPAEAKRSCATTRKHRAEFAKVLEIEGTDEVVVENEHATTVYRVGEIVRCHKWDADRWNECGGGIHFFLTRKEAEAW